MTEQSHKSDSYHPTAILLPFYLNGTLSDEECREVETHLKDCEDCKQELETMKGLHKEVKSYYANLPPPSPNVFNRVRAQIEQEIAAEASKPTHTERPPVSFFEKFQDVLHSIFSTQWAPALAMTLILGQAGLLMWSLTSRHPGTHTPTMGPVIERAIPPATIQEETSHIEIAFQEQTTDKEIRQILNNLHAHIVDGPTREGRYTIEIPAKRETRLQELLQELSQHPAIRTAKPVRSPNS